MEQSEEQSGTEDGPAVYRKPSGQSLGGLVAEAAVKRDPARAKLFAERRALSAAALRPITNLIQGDPSAAEAAARLRTLNRQLPSQHMARPYNVPVPGPIPLMVGQGTQVFIPPYDHTQAGPVNGVSLDKDNADTSTGTMHLEAYPAHDWDGDFSAIVGLGVDLQTSYDGWLEIRPLGNVGYYGFAKGDYLSSEVEGHIITSAVDVSTRKNVAVPTDFLAFVNESDSEANSGLSVSAPYIAIGFPAVAGVVYQIWFKLVMYGNQSGDDYFISFSYSYGKMDLTIPFFVTDLSTGPTPGG